MVDSNDELMMETMYWWGIPTLFRCEHNKDLAEAQNNKYQKLIN